VTNKRLICRRRIQRFRVSIPFLVQKGLNTALDVAVLDRLRHDIDKGYLQAPQPVILQALLKKSLGEMLKIHDRAVEKLFKMKNVTAVDILTHRLIVGTNNAIDTGEEGRAEMRQPIRGERGQTQPPWRGLRRPSKR